MPSSAWPDENPSPPSQPHHFRERHLPASPTNTYYSLEPQLLAGSTDSSGKSLSSGKSVYLFWEVFARTDGEGMPLRKLPSEMPPRQRRPNETESNPLCKKDPSFRVSPAGS